MGVKRQRFPVGDARDTSVGRYFLKLLLSGQIVADVMEVDLPLLLCLRILDQQRNGDGCATSASKNLSSFLLRSFSRSSLIPAQMKHIET